MKNFLRNPFYFLFCFLITISAFVVGCDDDGATDCDLFGDCGNDGGGGGGGGGGTCYYTQYNGSTTCTSSGYYPVSSTECCHYEYPYTNTYTNKCYKTCSSARDANSSGSVYKANLGGGGGGTCYYTQWTGTGSCIDAGYYPVYTGTCCSYSYPYYNTYTGSCYTSCESARNASSSGSIYKINTSSLISIPTLEMSKKLEDHISSVKIVD